MWGANEWLNYVLNAQNEDELGVRLDNAQTFINRGLVNPPVGNPQGEMITVLDDVQGVIDMVKTAIILFS